MQTKPDIFTSLNDGAMAESLFQEYLKANIYELSVSCFLEDSARYFGVFYEQDPHGEKNEKYLIN